MWLAKWGLTVLGVMFAVLAIGGLLLPAGVTVTRSIVVAAPPEKVYALVVDPRAWPRWTAWNRRDPQMRIDYSGPASGADATWRWKSKSEGSGAMTLIDVQPAHRVAYILYLADLGSTSAGELRFEARDGVTRVTWTMQADIGENPFKRWLALLAGRAIGKDFGDGLAALKTLAEKS